VREVLLQDVEVVAVRVERGESAFGPLLAVIAVIVVGRDVRHLLFAQDPNQTTRQRRLAGRGVTDDAEKDWPRHQTRTVSPESTRRDFRTA
jgi:hypothetical protein